MSLNTSADLHKYIEISCMMFSLVWHMETSANATILVHRFRQFRIAHSRLAYTFIDKHQQVAMRPDAPCFIILAKNTATQWLNIL